MPSCSCLACSSRGSLDSDWLGAPLTPVSTEGPWRFETEFTDLTDDEDPDEIHPSGFSRLSASLGELKVSYAEGVEQDRDTCHQGTDTADQEYGGDTHLRTFDIEILMTD